jgi:hypothetical protein
MNLKQFVNQIRKNQQWQIFPDFLMLIGVVGSLLYFVSVILFGYAIDGLTEQQIITMANLVSVSGIAGLSLCIVFGITGAYWKLYRMQKEQKQNAAI